MIKRCKCVNYLSNILQLSFKQKRKEMTTKKNNYENNNFEVLRNELSMTNRDFASLLGVADQVYSRMKKGNYSIGAKMRKRIESAFPNVSLKWVLYNEGERLKPLNTVPMSESESSTKMLMTSHINTFAKEIPYRDESGNNVFYETSVGRYILKTKLVTNMMRGEYLSHGNEESFINELPVHAISVTQPQKGVYKSFEQSDDSMLNENSFTSINEGYIVTGRKIDSENFDRKLDVYKYNFFVGVSKIHGVLTFILDKHNVEEGTIVATFQNQDKKRYPDLTLKLSELDELYRIINISINI